MRNYENCERDSLFKPFQSHLDRDLGTLNLGSPSRLLQPLCVLLAGSAGLNWIWPCIGERVAGGLSLRIQQVDVHVETKTKDDVFVRVVISVQFQVLAEQYFKAYYKLSGRKSLSVS